MICNDKQVLEKGDAKRKMPPQLWNVKTPVVKTSFSGHQEAFKPILKLLNFIGMSMQSLFGMLRLIEFESLGNMWKVHCFLVDSVTCLSLKSVGIL